MSKVTSSQVLAVSHADLLSRVPLFAALAPSQLAALSSGTQKLRYKRGEALIEQGDPSKALFVLISGRASVIARDSKGREIILATLGPGDALGEMSVLDGKPSSANVVADVQTDVLVLGQKELLKCLEDSHEAALGMMRALVARLRRADEKIESLALMDVYGRVARYLLDLSTKNPDGSYAINTKVSKQTMAKHVGASREMVSKVFKNLEKTGVIVSRSDGTLLLHEPSQALLH